MTLLSTDSLLGTLGPELSFHDIIRKKEIGNLPVKYFNNFEDIFDKLVEDVIQLALIAVKNSIHGEVGKNLELISKLDLNIVDCFDLPISLHLAAKESIRLEEIQRIYAHPVAWNECQLFLRSGSAQLVKSSSNSQAVIDLLNSARFNEAAISGEEAIRQSGLQLVKENIHDGEPNVTTFALVTKK